MTIAGRESIVPLELRLQRAKVSNAHGFTSLLLAIASVLQRGWWYAKSYLPIAGILLLAGGSLLVLQWHWLSRQRRQTPANEKDVMKDMSCIR